MNLFIYYVDISSIINHDPAIITKWWEQADINLKQLCLLLISFYHKWPSPLQMLMLYKGWDVIHDGEEWWVNLDGSNWTAYKMAISWSFPHTHVLHVGIVYDRYCKMWEAECKTLPNQSLETTERNCIADHCLPYPMKISPSIEFCSTSMMMIGQASRNGTLILCKMINDVCLHRKKDWVYSWCVKIMDNWPIEAGCWKY